MSTFIENLFNNDEKISIAKVAISLFGIITIRAFFENFSSPDFTGFFFSWKDTYLEYPLYYTSVFLSFGLLLYFFSKKSLNQILNFEITIFLFALFPPVIDLLVTQGKGLSMTYITTEPSNFLSAFFKTMNPLGFSGITPGIHFAAYFILISISIFIYKATKSKLRAISSVLIGYSILFLYAIVPSLIALPQLIDDKLSSATVAYMTTVQQSWLVTTSEQPGGILSIFQQLDVRTFQNAVTTQLFFLLVTLQLATFLIIFKPSFIKAIRKNLRMERIAYWFLIAFIGIFINQKLFGDINFSNTINILSLAVFFTLLTLNVWLAVCINDIEDITIDKISNSERPLAKKEVSISEWKNFQLILFVLVIFGTAIMNHAVGFLLILAQMAYYIYSAKPLRLKRHFVTSSILIGLSSVAISMAGFFMVSPDQYFSTFPIKALLLIGVSYALTSNFKDIKDFEGDRYEGMLTMPVVFGLENAKKIIAALFAIVFIAVPLFLKLPSMLLFSVCISLFTFHLFTKKNYQEKYIFLVIFLYMLTLFFTTY